MATSGTWAFAPDLSDVVEEAYERIGKEVRSGYSYRTARRSLDFMLLDWQNRGLNLWTVKEASESTVAGTASYALSAERFDVIEMVARTGTGTSQKDYRMRRISPSEYAHKIDKNMQSTRPTEFWLQQAPTGVTATVWPVPEDTTYTLRYWYLERIEDTGTSANTTMDIPPRFLPAMVAGLAYQLAMKDPERAPMLPGLNAEYERLLMDAMHAARDKSSFKIRPSRAYS